MRRIYSILLVGLVLGFNIEAMDVGIDQYKKVENPEQIVPVPALSRLVFDHLIATTPQYINFQEKTFEEAIKPLAIMFRRLPQDLKDRMFKDVLEISRKASEYYQKQRHLLGALVAAGADQNVKDLFGRVDFLSRATYLNDVEVVRLLLAHNVCIDFTQNMRLLGRELQIRSIEMAGILFAYIQDISYFSHYFYCLADSAYSPDLVRWYIEKGIDVTPDPNGDKSSFLHCLIVKGYTYKNKADLQELYKKAEYVLNKAPKLMHAQNKYGVSPFLICREVDSCKYGTSDQERSVASNLLNVFKKYQVNSDEVQISQEE